MSYKALYRTHRPTNFDEIKGQKHITTTLKNIINSEKVSHAYLFSGPRGTGKTSAAKVFANVLNCKNLSQDLKPCLKCNLCIEAQKGSSMDIIEIDAASNNGVAEIRELRDNVKYSPTSSRYKIYIIDEVHMLSKGAFNALLKTLEEPPQHAIFILATTEPHKIPVTILSRTQRFNFRRVEDDVLVSHLIEVLDKESLEYDKSAIRLIAKLANGGLRDALSIADQASSYTNGSITFEAISQVFGIVSLESQVSVINFAASKNVDGLLSLINKFVDGGADLTRLSTSLIDIVKDFIVFNKTDQEQLLEILNKEQIKELKLTVDSAYNMLDILVDLITQLSRTEYPRQVFELAMLKLTKSTVNTIVEEKKSPVLENKEPAFSVDKEQPKEKFSMPEPTPAMQAPINEGGNIQSETAIDPTTNIKFLNPKETKQDLEKLFSTQELEEKIPIEDSIIDMNEIESSTQVISSVLEEESQAQDIETDVISLDEQPAKEPIQEKQKEEEIALAETINEPEDLLSLFSTETKDEVSQVKVPEYSVADIINLLVQTDKKIQEQVKKSWLKIISYSTESKYSEFTSLLEEAKLIASGENFLLISSKDENICKRINEVKSENNFKELIMKVIGKPKNIFAITREKFMDVKERYVLLAKSNSLPAPRKIEDPILGDQQKTKANKLGEDLFGELFSSK